ncbi:hypothetical protein TNCV_760631 [Trichonephila clavipes]|nr:hypothetical protein TNCV_760631 [Trichonephila clavipes]
MQHTEGSMQITENLQHALVKVRYQMIIISAQTLISHVCGSTSKRYLRLGDFYGFKFGNCFFLVDFGKQRSVICLVEKSDQILIKYPSSTKEGYGLTEIVDYVSGKSVVVLDETKQL